MKNTVSLFLLVLVASPSIAQVEQVARTNDFLGGMLATSRSQCSEIPAATQRYEQEGKKATAEALKDSMYMMCECIPKKLQSLRLTLAASDLNTRVSETQFVNNTLSPIIEQCGAAQLKHTYSDSGCQDRTFAKNKKNPAQYCSCMSRNLSLLSDAEIMQTSTDTADYAPRAVDAKKKGLPAPMQPSSVQRFYSLDATCSAE